MTAPEVETEERVDVLDRPGAGTAAIRGTAVRTAGFAVVLLLGLISAPILTRHLGIVEFGRYASVVSLVTLLSLVTEAGLGALGVRELAVLDDAGKQRFMRHLLGIRMSLTVVGALAAVAFAALAGYGPTLVLGTALAGVGALAFAAQGSVALPLYAQLRLGWISAADVMRQAVFVVMTVLLVIAGAGVAPLLAATIPAGLASAALLLVPLRGHAVWRPSFERRAWTRMLRAAFPIAAAGAINSAYFRVVILLMSVIASGVETGYFALSFRVVEVLVAVPSLAMGALMPILSRAARDDQERLAFAFTRSFDAAVAAGAFLALLTFVGAPLAMSVLTGHADAPAVGVLRIQALSLVVVFLNVAYASVLIALHRHRDLVVANLATLAFTLVAAAVLIPLLGAEGGGIAAAAGEWSLLVGYALVLRRARPDLRPRVARVPRVAAAVVVAAAAAALVDVPRVPNLGAAVVAAVVFPPILLILRGVPEELMQALRRRDSTPS